ncbi:MAG: N-acetylmuramidase [Hymenobacter sp.]|nr:N-acetylmuramidase [Hymenobacter sp.]
MAEFAHFLPKLLAAEGGYCHTPGDAGQETWRGVARAYQPAWCGWELIDLAKKRRGLASPVPAAAYPRLNKALAADPLLAVRVRALYKTLYWDALRLDDCASQAVAEQLADHGVNAGTGRPPRMLQYALRQLCHPEVTEDGCLGPRTLAAANACPAPALFGALAELRRDFYRYRAGALALPLADPLRGLFERLRVRPDARQRKFLGSWLSRVAAIAPPAG